MADTGAALTVIQRRRCVLTNGLWSRLTQVLGEAMFREHEGVTYFLGQTNGYVTTAVACVKVQSRATLGSFQVAAGEMRRVVDAANQVGLQVVGQLHTHPELAFHSVGDAMGAQIKYDGYVSIVVPYYGRVLPSLTGVKSYMFSRERSDFVEIDPSDVHVVSEVL